jgi:hypothetical protein
LTQPGRRFMFRETAFCDVEHVKDYVSPEEVGSSDRAGGPR